MIRFICKQTNCKVDGTKETLVKAIMRVEVKRRVTLKESLCLVKMKAEDMEIILLGFII
jgi:hypothetical protein